MGLGVNLDHVAIAALDLKKAGHQDAREIRSIVELMANRIRHLPDIDSVSLSSGSLLGAGGGATFVGAMRGTNGRDAGFHGKNAVTPEYFASVGTHILSGRAFMEADDAASERVMIIDEFLANIMWPGEPAVGKYVSAGSTFRVVGICESRRSSAAFQRPSGEAFVPLAQAGITDVPRAILIRTRRTPRPAQPRLLQPWSEALPRRLPFISVQPLGDLVDIQTRSWRVGRTMFSAFGAVSLLLASLGLYAILAFSVRQRISEIGVRKTIGATTLDILQLVFRQGLQLVALGWMLGIGTALLLTKYIEKLLFRVEPIDTVSFVFASLFVLAAAVAGCVIPSIRAARMDPVVALRHE